MATLPLLRYAMRCAGLIRREHEFVSKMVDRIERYSHQSFSRAQEQWLTKIAIRAERQRSGARRPLHADIGEEV